MKVLKNIGMISLFLVYFVKRYGLKSFPDPTQFGNTDRKRLEDSNVKQFLHHTKADKIQKNLFKKIIKEIKRIFLKKI